MIPSIAGILRAAPEPGEPFDITEMILSKLVDGPYWDTPFGRLYLPQFEPVQIGPLLVDFSITRHVLAMMLVATGVAIMMILAARGARREQAAGAERGPKGAANVVEAAILFVRDEIALKNIGRGGERYVPYIVTVFFFILFSNLFGLIPWGITSTGNISVTAALAVMSLGVIEFAGMRELGFKGYMGTIFYAPHGLPAVIRLPLYVIMTPVEIMGKLAKPFALAIRLFANMTAGQALVLALKGLLVVATAANAFWVIPAPLFMAVAIMTLELLIAFIQAYVFAVLSSVFIGLIRHAH
jgi:F-type H+-transporting ATPase subunit a